MAGGKTNQRASVLQRVVAKAIDLFLVIAVSAILPSPVGSLLGFFYSLAADGMNVKNLIGQSIGKRVIGLQVIHSKTGEPATLRDSIIRNSPIGVATFFAIIPVWGWIFLILVGVPLVGIEIYLMRRAEGGLRLGDVMADTEVVFLGAGGKRS